MTLKIYIEHSANNMRTFQAQGEQSPVCPLAYQVVEMVGIYRCNSRVVSQEFLSYSKHARVTWFLKMIPLYGLNEMGETYSTEPNPVSYFDPIS